MFLISFREQELQLQPQAPIRTIIGCFHIVESLNLGVHRLVADLEDLTETAAMAPSTGCRCPPPSWR